MCVCAVGPHVRSHSRQLDVIVAQHCAVRRASCSPHGSNDVLKRVAGDGGALWKINAVTESLQVSNVCSALAI